MNNSVNQERMAEIMELYSDCIRYTYDEHMQELERIKNLGTIYNLTQEQGSFCENCIDYNEEDEEFTSILVIFFVEATLRNQSKIYDYLHEYASKSVNYTYENINNFHLPEAEKKELLQYAKKVEKQLETATIMQPSEQFAYEPEKNASPAEEAPPAPTLP